jgi:small subunit ribosomal protein S11
MTENMKAKAGANKVTQKVKARKKVKHITECVIYVVASFNNTIITAVDLQGNPFVSGSAGREFRGSRKSTPFAAQVTADKVAKQCAESFGVKSAHVKVKGPGPGRESAIRALGPILKVLSIEDVTGIPHNGCRDPKKRRV